MMICVITLISGCNVQSEAAFKDIQRHPPVIERETVDYLIGNNRPLIEWIAETGKKCDKFGCV